MSSTEGRETHHCNCCLNVSLRIRQDVEVRCRRSQHLQPRLLCLMMNSCASGRTQSLSHSTQEVLKLRRQGPDLSLSGIRHVTVGHNSRPGDVEASRERRDVVAELGSRASSDPVCGVGFPHQPSQMSRPRSSSSYVSEVRRLPRVLGGRCASRMLELLGGPSDVLHFHVEGRAAQHSQFLDYARDRVFKKYMGILECHGRAITAFYESV